MQSMFLNSPVVPVSAGALAVILALAACQPSQPTPSEGPPEAEAAAVAAAPATVKPADAPAPAPAEVEPPAAEPSTPSQEAVGRPLAPVAAEKVVQEQQMPPAAAAKPALQPGVLPAGAGRNVAQRLCGTCHSLILVTANGHTEAEWDSIVARMESNGMQASADDINTVIDYLSKALPPR